MLVQQQKIQFSSYSPLNDLIVPKDIMQRKINELIDFSFIYDELLNKYCTNNGRTAESPVRMFKYLLLKTIYTIADVDVVERSRFDMSLNVDAKNFKMSSHLTTEAAGSKGYMQTDTQTPWRTIIVSGKAAEILASKLILNRNEPTSYTYVSWIKLMKYIGIWWEYFVAGKHLGVWQGE